MNAELFRSLQIRFIFCNKFPFSVLNMSGRKNAIDRPVWPLCVSGKIKFGKMFGNKIWFLCPKPPPPSALFQNIPFPDLFRFVRLLNAWCPSDTSAEQIIFLRTLNDSEFMFDVCSSQKIFGSTQLPTPAKIKIKKKKNVGAWVNREHWAAHIITRLPLVRLNT